jgi:hypothetical protein
MDIEKLKKTLHESIEILYDKDFHLIKHNLNERSIVHKLAMYLTKKLSKSGLDVDCEYNGDIENIEGNYRKRLVVLTSELKIIGREFRNKDEFQSLTVFPDIIIHKRGENKRNSLIIEVKKEYTGRTIGDKFDRMKLYHYTSEYHGNSLKYNL